MEELDEIATGTKFNGNNILNAATTFKVQVGANAGETRDITMVDTQAATLSVDTLDLATSVATASAAITAIDAALDTVQSGRSNMGAYQNRMEQTITNLDVSINNQTASRGRIQDADFAKETADMTKNQILAQAGVAMLSQANQLPQNVLSLLR
jgi:flagellin